MTGEMASQRVTIPIRPSRILLIIILCSHSLAVVALLMTDISWMLRGSLFVAVLLHAVYSWQKYYSLKQRDSVIQVIRSGNSWSLRLAGGSNVPATLAHIVTTSFLTLLNFKSAAGGRKYAVLLLPDTTDQQSIRQLRGWLHYGLKRPQSDIH